MPNIPAGRDGDNAIDGVVASEMEGEAAALTVSSDKDLSRLGCCQFRRHGFKLLKPPRTVPD